MSGSWKLSAFAPKALVQDALLRHDEIEDWDPDLVISGREIAEDRPDEWVLEAWYPAKPRAEQKSALARLFAGKSPVIKVEALPDQDWLVQSQQGVDPIHAGRFCVHTPEHDGSAEHVNLTIPASQAFGTGQHETTAGCLAMLDWMRRRGFIVRNVADIGTGTGLLGFAAMHLWPNARSTASDIDPVCAGVVADNAALNAIKLGPQRGAMMMVIADGMEDALLQMRAPYDLLIANILAGPLVGMAPEFADSVPDGGHILLAGLLTTQEANVRRAYRQAGFHLRARRINGDWSILLLRKRRSWRA